LATHDGLSLEWCAVICNLSPMALYRLVCAFGHHSLVTVLTRCGLPLPAYFLADEKHSRCLTEKVYLPTIVSGRVLWHLGYTTEASANRATTSFTLAGHSADFTLASFLWSPPVVGTSQPWRRQTMIWARSLIQPVVFKAEITYSQLFSHFRGSLRPFRGECDVLRLAARRSTHHDPPPFFQRA